MSPTTAGFAELEESQLDVRTSRRPLRGRRAPRAILRVIITSHALESQERQRLEADTEVILSKQPTSREIAIHPVRNAHRSTAAGVVPPRASGS